MSRLGIMRTVTKQAKGRGGRLFAAPKPSLKARDVSDGFLRVSPLRFGKPDRSKREWLWGASAADNQAMPKHVALYVRCSTEEQATENQIRELRAVAERHGWTIAGVFDDAGIGGGVTREDRPAMKVKVRALLNAGHSEREVSRLVGVGKGTISRLRAELAEPG
jgi:hypothetical protein